jgi:hypothetical protein
VDRAEEAFAQLLSRDASAPAPQAAPKVREAFARAKQQLYAADYVKLRALAAPANEVRVELIDPWSLVREVVLSEAGAGAFAESSLRLEEGRYAGPLANASQRYFVRALDGSKRELASLGTSTEPLKILVEAAPVASINLPPQPAPGPVLVAPAPLPEPKSRAPVWVAGAASAAALIAGVALAVACSSDSRSAGEAGFSSDRKALDDSARDQAIGANVLIGLAVVGGAGTVVLAWAW